MTDLAVLVRQIQGLVRPCTGDPNGQISAPVGSLALRRDGGAATTLYVKEGGAAGNTGWVPK